MGGGQRFSKIDLSQAYMQVVLDEESRKYLVLNTSKGLMEPTRMPYGIKPATAIFQRHITSALSSIPRTVVKVDDILVSGENDADHLDNLNKVFTVLNNMGATVNKKKCNFFAPQVEYVGFIIDRHGIRTNPKKVEAIKLIPEPQCLKELQSFIGGINYYARFIPNMANIAKPLFKLMEKETRWEWTTTARDSFNKLKSCLSHPRRHVVFK